MVEVIIPHPTKNYCQIISLGRGRIRHCSTCRWVGDEMPTSVFLQRTLTERLFVSLLCGQAWTGMHVYTHIRMFIHLYMNNAYQDKTCMVLGIV